MELTNEQLQHINGGCIRLIIKYGVRNFISRLNKAVYAFFS